ncbi:putative methyltransferase NSUN7 [Gopherus evgoodei]|uniref:putative methyltransferase NSUN7 n=1 Tax=Gopherus evgoodei TaxID=1825980 RepID=UPI0011CFAE42|nr:putative methyltransferase NSUN7 [Gopherus evgoodei]XP_030421296.1 putative methyltransferase NSUN7 [Gopherus evgoodei]
MPSSKSNLMLSSDISNFKEMAISNEREPVEKSASLIENNGYQDSVYINAAKIFQGIHNEKPQDKILVRYGNELVPSLPDFKDECSQRSSYELAFSAVKYQDLLENILLDSCFYPCQSIPDELTSLIVVMLYDLQDRKFQARQISDEEESIPEVRDVERYLYSFKTKLAAALARCRIKHDALSIEYILPETLRKQEQRASALPLYAWINTLKSSLEDIYKELKKEGFTKVESVSDFEGYTYCLDKHCHDVLVFPASLKEEILNLELFTGYKLILQDKSRSLAVHSVKAFLNRDDDIIVAHMGSRLTAAHMSVLSNQSTSKVFVCGVKSQAKEVELKELFTRMACGNIELLHEDFTEIEPTDQRLQKAKVILLLPRCSGLGVSNPIEFILNEHEDAGLLRDLSQGSVAENKLHILAERQRQELMHAMRFNKAQAIVYCTCSVYPEENEAVVNKALESGVEGSKVQPYRLSPPLWCNSEIEGPSDIFFKMEPSEISNCCFLAVLARQRDPAEVMSVKDILARAAAKGLLEGLDIGKSSKREEKRKKKSKVTQQRNVPKDTGVQTNIVEFLNREMISINTNSEVSPIKAISGVPQKNVNQTNSSIQLKKITKPISNSSLPGMLKNAPNLSSMSKVFERRTHIRKPRAEDKMVVLKPVEIVLPPVMVPYFNPQGNKSQISAQHYYYRWTGIKSSARDLFIPSLSKRFIKPKETLPSTMVKHPRPWI